MNFSVAQWLLFFSLLYDVEAQCVDDTSFEYPNAYTFTDSVNNETTATGYLLEPADYHVPYTCTCGLLKQWQFFALGPGAIQLQVWRREASNSYILLGENYYTVPVSAVGRKIEFLVPAKDRITVRNGDLLGWYTGPGVNIVAFTQGPQNQIISPQDEYPDGIKMQTAMSYSAVGETFDWNSGSVTVLEDTIYAFGATVVSNRAPEFTNLDHTAILYPSWVAGAVIYTVTVDDMDSYDVDTLEVTMEADITVRDSGYYVFDRTTLEVSLITSSPPEDPSTILTFTVSDQCGSSNTGILEIIVKNEFPLVNSLPLFISLAEETTKEVLLATFSLIDDDDSSSNFTETFNVDPNIAWIEIRSEGTNERRIYSTASAIYDYTSQQMYVMDFTFSDGTDTSNTGYALLYITKNDPPKITNLENAAYLNTSFVSTVNGETLFTVETSDAESDAVTFSVTCNPTPCPVESPNPTDGVIKTIQDFQDVTEPGFDLTITIEDSKTTAADTKSLTILVQEITYRPQITNLPLDNAILISEGTALGTTVYTLSYIDLDTSESHTIYAELDPGWAWNYFSLNSANGVITTDNNVIDYEFLNSTTAVLTITVTDSFGPTSETIDIEFGDVNEAPYFSQTKYTLEPSETASSGDSAGDPQFQIYDPDAGDTHTYSWDCGDASRYFIINTTGAISYATDFDLDDVNEVTTSVPFTCIVTVTDSGGLTGTTQLEIDIHDDNDNAPKFSQSTDYIIYAEPSLTSGKFVGQVSATDDDYSASNRDIFYSINDINNLFDENYIYINDYGNIFVNTSWKYPPFQYGEVIVFEVIALNTVDTNQTRQSATATVSIVNSATSTTSTSTTDRPVDFIADTRNVAWISVAVALVAIVVIMLCMYALYYTMSTKKYRWCCPMCRRYLLGLSMVMKQKKIERYKHILKKDEEEGSSSSYESSSESSSDSDDSIPPAKQVSFKPWKRNNNVTSADSKNFKPWTRSERL